MNIRWPTDQQFSSDVWKAWPLAEPKLAERERPAEVTPEGQAYADKLHADRCRARQYARPSGWFKDHSK